MLQTVTVKYKWDNPYTGRVWHECGNCSGIVSKESTACKHCGAQFYPSEVWEKMIASAQESENEYD